MKDFDINLLFLNMFVKGGRSIRIAFTVTFEVKPNFKGKTSGKKLPGAFLGTLYPLSGQLTPLF